MEEKEEKDPTQKPDRDNIIARNSNDAMQGLENDIARYMENWQPA